MHNNKDIHAGALEIISELTNFIDGNTVKTSSITTPQLVSLPLFKGVSLRSRVANKISKIPLRFVRKSTQDYYLYQKNLNSKLERDVETLKYQLQLLRNEVNDRK